MSCVLAKTKSNVRHVAILSFLEKIQTNVICNIFVFTDELFGIQILNIHKINFNTK